MHPLLPVATERRFLPALAQGFALGGLEPLAEGLRRVALDQFDGALTAMATEPRDVAVHEVRKATKRVRAILRLVRDPLGATRYRVENAMLRDTARLLAPLRDADVHVASVRLLRERYVSQLRPSAFEQPEHHLSERRRRLYEHIADGDDWTRVLHALRSARSRYAAWPVEADTARVLGMPVIPHSYSSLESGFSRTYARGRREMGAASRKPTAENLHAWRKRVKYLSNQVRIVAPVFPEALDGFAAALERLGDLLGSDHDLAELLALVAQRPDLAPDPAERSLLVALVQHGRAELQTAALSLGARVYVEKPARFVRRIGDYWEAWDSPLPVGFIE